MFRSTITNFGDRQISNTVASLYLDGTRVAQQSITVAGHATATVVLSAVPKRRGIIGVMLHIDDDPLDLDNNYHIVLHIPERIAITCIGSTPADTRYPALALSAAIDSTQAGVFAVQQTTHDRMQFADLGGRDVIVLSNIHVLTPSEASRIADAVKSGRGLVIFPGNETDYEQLNKGLLSTLGIPTMLLILRQLAPDRTGFVTFSDVDFRHPVFEGCSCRNRANADPLLPSSPRAFALRQASDRGHRACRSSL